MRSAATGGVMVVLEEEFVAAPARPQETTLTIRVLIADDHSAIRRGLRALLSSDPGLQVVGEAGDGPEAIRRARELEPDVVLLDVSMPGEDGIRVARELKTSCPHARVLILTMHEDAGLVRAAIEAGAAGYLIKRAKESEILNAIYAAHRGDLYLHPAMARALAEPAAAAHPPSSGQEPLTEPQVAVLKMLARGHTHRQIAEALGLSARAVDDVRAALVQKLGISSRVEFLSYAEKHGQM